MADIFVSVHGDDAHEGSERHPVQTLKRAQVLARERLKSHPKVVVEIGGGTYYLRSPPLIGRTDSGTTYRGKAGEEVVLSGATRLETHWKPHRDGIWRAELPRTVDIDGLFINGEPQILARYPKFDPNVAVFNGFAADAISPERVARWKDPAGAYFHAMHLERWGSFHYQITGKDTEGNLIMEGGWRNNRRNGIHPEHRFVEGVFEELDTPGEWFFDRNQRILYYYPHDASRLAKAKVEAASNSTLIFFNGTHNHEIRDIHFQGLTLRHTARTFMQNKHPLLRSDWTIAHDGAIKLDGTSDCSFTDLRFEHLGGNAMFLHAWNKRIVIRSCHFHEIGANGIAFVGSPASVRNPLYDVDHHQSFDTIDKVPGPKRDFYPADCLVEDCLITRTGRIEKQSAPIQISMAQRIIVRHCSIYDVPRAGINIGDGCWGGHVIEFCDIFDTVKETGDHGSFNSWGRDRYWQLSDKDANQLSGPKLEKIPFLDAFEPVTLRNNRWRCDHG